MSLYANYLRERTNDLILETEKGFATYRYLESSVYIMDIYVLPDFRQSDEASRMANMIIEEAKTKGCKKMIGSVIPSNKDSTISLKVLMAFGLKLVSSIENFIVFEKEI